MTPQRMIIGIVVASIALIFLTPAKTLTWPFMRWALYSNPSAQESVVESPVLIVVNEAGGVDTVYAAQFFTPVEFRVSERVLLGAFEERRDDVEAYRATIEQRLRLESGTVVEGYLLSWNVDPSEARLLDRRRPATSHLLGTFVVE